MTPGDDPVAAARIYRINTTIKQMDQYNTNGNFAQTRLNLEDSTLSDFTNVTQRIRELGILGMSDTQNSDGRKAIAAEMSGLLENLKSIANTQDSNGEFILSGDKTNKAPYQQVTSANVTTLSTGLSAPQPAAYFTVGDGATPVTVTRLDGSVLNMDGVTVPPGPNYPAPYTAASFPLPIPAANQIVDNFNGNTYTLNATTGGYEDANQQPVFGYFGATSGSRFVQIAPDDDNTDPGKDQGDASRVRISDQGAKTFGNYSHTSSTPWGPAYSQTANPQMNYNIFDTVRQMVNQLNTGTTGAPNIPANASKMDELMAELDTSMKSVSDTRTDVGTRLQRIDMQNSINQDFKSGLTSNLSKLRDEDMVTGISDYQKTLSGLQMAQLTYSKISDLSLFNYIK
jgi:flagellar hook-associated protein 3 FlgL